MRNVQGVAKKIGENIIPREERESAVRSLIMKKMCWLLGGTLKLKIYQPGYKEIVRGRGGWPDTQLYVLKKGLEKEEKNKFIGRETLSQGGTRKDTIRAMMRRGCQKEMNDKRMGRIWRNEAVCEGLKEVLDLPFPVISARVYKARGSF